MQPRTWALVPLKSGERAKSRLAGTLDAGQRRQLFFTMARRVIVALQASRHIDAVAVVTSSADICDFAQSLAALPIVQEQDAGMCRAIEAALRTLDRMHPERVLMVPGDLPLICTGAIDRIFADQRSPEQVVVVPDRHRNGTNALLCCPPRAIAPCFGPFSFTRHLLAARNANLTARVLEIEKSRSTWIAQTIWKFSAPAQACSQATFPTTRRWPGDTMSLAFPDDRPTAEQCYELLAYSDWRTLAPLATKLREQAWGARISYSRKVFAPLTQLCRDVCHYCTFAKTPGRLSKPYLTPDDILRIARDGAALGCKELLFTLGDRPELRYAQAREALAELGFPTTLAYLEYISARVVRETGLLPHLNPGLMTAADLARLRHVAPSMGIMLESASERLCERGGPHFGSPDKHPSRRLATLREAGAAHIPMTTGILIGIGETRRERIDALLALREISDRYGHIQEIIVQNFRAKPGTKMQHAPEPSNDELRWTIAAARLIFGAQMSIQAPPNLYKGDPAELIAAGINDWGGVSPLTPDHVNPEAPWPHLGQLAAHTARAGCDLVERLTVYPRYVNARDEWIADELHTTVLRLSDSAGWARVGRWCAGAAALHEDDVRDIPSSAPSRRSGIADLVERARGGDELTETQIAELFTARGPDFVRICHAANELRQEVVGDTVTYAVVRNINYTNICLYKCRFCAFSKGRTHEHLRGAPYLLELDEIKRRVREAWQRGGTEVCMQGGIHPSFTGHTYLEICRAAKQAQPEIHIHAFSPLEVSHGARTLGISIQEYLMELKQAGLGSLPGTAAEILDDDVRRVIAPDKLTTQEWLDVVAHAHRAGLPTTATIMFGHIEGYEHWARHLLLLRRLQEQTGGLTEFVPLPFVHMEAPMYLRGRARKGPTLRETLLMHAVGRLALHRLIRNVQASWVKLGPRWAQRCLELGANDLGGTLMNESISRAAGAAHGQELEPGRMQQLSAELGRPSRQRTTLYGDACDSQVARADCSRELHVAPGEPAI